MLLFLFVLVALAAVMEWLSLRDTAGKLDYRCELSAQCCEPGEEFTIRSSVINRSRLPVPFLKIRESFPLELETAGKAGQPVTSLSLDGQKPVSSILSLKGRQIVRRERKGSISRRGVYHFNGCRLSRGDFLGLREMEQEIPQEEELVIYPKALDDSEFELTMGNFFGDISVRRFFIEDPILISGYHDYTGSEPMRQISWKQSARLGKMIAREFDHTRELSVTVLLNVSLFGRMEERGALLEGCYSMARSVCEFLCRRDVSFRFCSNAELFGKKGAVPSDSGKGYGHLQRILENLGRSTYSAGISGEELLEDAGRRWSGETAFLLISPLEEESLTVKIRELSERLGIQVYPLYVRREGEGR